MALTRFLLIFVLSTSWIAGNVVVGQLNLPGPRFYPQDNELTDATMPFAQPGIFDWDAQMFAPVEFNNGKQRQPNTGYNFGYQRGYVSLSRGGQVGPTETNIVPVGSDWGWGNRFQFGYMTEQDRGWELAYQYTHLSYFGFGTDEIVATPLLVNTRFSEFEANRVFRQALSSGDYFEPYVGLKYINLSDNSLEDTTLTVNGAAATNRFKQNATNSAPGFQAGGRYNAMRGRFRYTWDAAIVTAYNQQNYHASDFVTIAGALGTSEQFFSSQSFLPAVDGAFEVAYNLSRDIAFRSAVQGMYIWRGVNRTNNLTTAANPNSTFGTGNDFGIFDNDFVAVGFTFGFEWKR